MRVALLTTFHQRDGLATYAESLVDAVRAAGDEVVVLAPRLTGGDAAIGDQPPRLWGARHASIAEAFATARAIAASGADLVHLNVNLSLFSARFLLAIRAVLRARGTPTIVTLHCRQGGWPARRFKVWRVQRAFAGLDVVVHTEAHAAELHAAGHRRVHVIPHGVPALNALPMDVARARLGLDLDRPVLTHFGFLFPHKGVLEVLHAMAKLRARGFPRLFYWISGAVYRTRESQRYFRRIRRAIDELGLAGDVHLSGEFVSEGEAMLAMQAATWVVLNYLHGSAQGASGAVTRALASGRPVAVSPSPFFDDVRDATHTLVGDLETALAHALTDDALAQRAQSGAARRCAEASWSTTAERYRRLYRAVASATARSG